MRLARVARAGERFAIHPRERQHTMRRGILGDRRHEAEPVLKDPKAIYGDG